MRHKTRQLTVKPVGLSHSRTLNSRRRSLHRIIILLNCFVELKKLTKFVAAQVCRPHMLFLCLHAVCSPSKSFGTSMEKCFMSREKLFVKILLEKKELNIVTASEDL